MAPGTILTDPTVSDAVPEAASRTRPRTDRTRQLLGSLRRAFARERELNQRLQEAILPAPAPVREVNGVRVVVRYRGADRGVRVAGDWYLADPLPDGDVLLAVGDVMGHGLPAVATMARLRHAMAALATLGYPPAEILVPLNSLLYQEDAGTLATAVVARYRPATGVLTWARAGHPPVLLATPRSVEPLWHPEGVILGVSPDVGYTDATIRLGAGDVVMMYTDGVVDEYGVGMAEGVRRLGDSARPAGLSIVDRMAVAADLVRRPNRRDDACVLVAEPVR